MDTAIYAQVGIIGNESVIQIDVVFTNMKVSFFFGLFKFKVIFIFYHPNSLRKEALLHYFQLSQVYIKG